MRAALITLTLVGCYQPESFETDIDVAICEWSTECMDEPNTTTGSYDYCYEEDLTDGQGFAYSCAFDRQRARACVRGIKRMPCVGADVTMPAECDDVWVCGEEP